LLDLSVDDPAPVGALAELLERAVRDSGGAPLLVLTHRSPDPDALGALIGMRRLVEDGLGLPASIRTLGRIHRAENVAMVRELGLDFPRLEADVGPTAGIVLADSQPGFGHTVLPEDVPVLAVVDHHVTGSDGSDLSEVPHADVRPDLGSTSSLVYAYLRDAGVEIDRFTATALFCGVRFDTADLAWDASSLDEEAWFETFRRADRLALARIQRPPLPHDYYRELQRSLTEARRHGPLVLALLGRVGNPESVAEMADFFVRREGCRVALVGGAFEDTYGLSLRTVPGFEAAGPLLARILTAQVLSGRGSCGGHGRIAGGRVRLDGDEPPSVEALEDALRVRALDLLVEDPAHKAGEPVA
jgi:nanoRNase/pAp phosphatase (c-di-AMP/oligoRNAs hydrolase)